LIFAVQAENGSQSDAVLPHESPVTPKGLRILVVDDDPILLNSLRDTLQADGHFAVTASGGQMGIDTFREAWASDEPFDFVITDLGMPYVDGRKVAQTIKETSPATPVILLTGWGQRMVNDGDVPAPVDRVLGKPPKLREIREALSQLSRLAES
jgi:CheY-like chemotaxis protein